MAMTILSKRILEAQTIDNVTIVSILGRIVDEQVIDKLGEQLNNLVDPSGQQRILINFKKVESFSSAAFGKLIAVHKKLEATKGKLAFSNIDPTIYEAFKILKLDSLFMIFNDEQEAFNFLKKQ